MVPGMTRRVIPKKTPDWLDKNHQVPYQLGSCPPGQLTPGWPVMLLGGDWSRLLSPSPARLASQSWLRLAPVSTWAWPVPSSHNMQIRAAWMNNQHPCTAASQEAPDIRRVSLSPPIPGSQTRDGPNLGQLIRDGRTLLHAICWSNCLVHQFSQFDEAGRRLLWLCASVLVQWHYGGFISSRRLRVRVWQWFSMLGWLWPRRFPDRRSWLFLIPL